MQDFENLRQLLEKETYPHPFFFKFIGKNSSLFKEGTQKLKCQFPDLTLRSHRLSQNQNHIAYTYILEAKSVGEIIEIFHVISKIPDLSMIL